MGTNAGLSIGAVVNNSPGGAVAHQLPSVPVAFTDHQVFLSVYEFVVPGSSPPTTVTGNGVTDDTAAIQAAINAVAGSGRALYFPAGTYYVNSAALTNALGVPMLFAPGAASATGTYASSLTGQWYPVPGPASVSLSIAAGGTITLTAQQAAAKTIICTGSLAGNVTLVFPSNASQEWLVDVTGVTLNAHTITAQANGNNWGTQLSATQADVARISYDANAGKLYGVLLTP